MVSVPIKRLDPDLPMPAAVRGSDAAADLPASSATKIEPGDRALVPTGFAVAIPEGYCGLILPRSGLALKQGLTVLNGPGLIDAGYRGELRIVLHNAGSEVVAVERGQRIAQLLVLPVSTLNLVETTELTASPDSRGEAGFGSSG